MADVSYLNNIDEKCTCTPSNVTNVTVGTVFTITANDGFKFCQPYKLAQYDYMTSPRIRLRNVNDIQVFSTNPEYFTISQSADNKTITFTCIKNLTIGTITNYLCRETDDNHPIEIDNSTILTLTKNLSNVTLSPDVSSIVIDGTSKVITLTANSGYDFSGVPKLTISDTDYNFSLSNGVYTLDVNNIGINSNVSGTITASAIAVPQYPVCTIIKQLENVTISPDVSSITIDGTSKVITLTANNGYEFSGVPYFVWNRYIYNFTQLENSYIYDLNDVIDENASITIHATATVTAKTKNVTNQLTNCSVTPSFNVMVENETYTLTLNTNQGYKFVTTPQLKINDRNRVILDFTKVTDYQYILSFTADSGYFDTSVNAELFGIAVEETPIVNKYGAIQVYRPSNSDMASLSNKRYKQNGTVDGITYNDVDLGSYITQFKRVFFNIVSTSKSNILLGVHDTEINTDVVNDDDITIDCGTVFINGANGNELDTKIYKIKIVLPFYEVVELSSIYMNKTIHIVYQANVITGYADILINEVVNNTDLLIVKYRCKISQDLPYILDYDKLNGALSDMQLNTSPKIILQKNNTFIDKGFNTYKEDLISNETGYFEIKDIVSMSINATQKEKDMIENILKTGIYI